MALQVSSSSDKSGCMSSVTQSILFFIFSFHVGLGANDVSNSSSSSYLATIHAAEKVISYAEELGFKFSILDIGGGFAGHPDQFDNLRKWSVSVNECVEEVMAKHPMLQFIAEPGNLHALYTQLNYYCSVISSHRQIFLLLCVYFGCECDL